MKKEYFCGEIMWKLEKTAQNMVDVSMRGGLVLGLILAGCIYLSVLSPAISLFLLVMMFFSMYRCMTMYVGAYRDEVMGGVITYGRSFHLCLFLSFFASTIVAVAVFVYCKWIDPDGFSQTVRVSSQYWGKQAYTEGQVSVAKQMRLTTAADMAFSSIWIFSILGCLVSLVASFMIVRKNKKK